MWGCVVGFRLRLLYTYISLMGMVFSVLALYDEDYLAQREPSPPLCFSSYGSTNLQHSICEDALESMIHFLFGFPPLMNLHLILISFRQPGIAQQGFKNMIANRHNLGVNYIIMLQSGHNRLKPG